MELYVCTMFFLYCISIVTFVYKIGWMKYPKIITRKDDTISLIFTIPFFAWSLYLVVTYK